MTGVNELARRAKHSPEAMERLKQQYQPLIAARVMLHMGFWRPEYMEAGQAAVEEAAESWREEKGSFTTHLRQVLKFRLIDLRRREKVDKVVPVSSLSEEKRVQAVNAASVSAHREEEEVLRRREEIAQFASELEALGLITRVPSASDKRVTQIYPTNAMLELYPKIREIAKTWNEGITVDCTARELEIFLSVLNRITRRARILTGQEGADPQ